MERRLMARESNKMAERWPSTRNTSPTHHTHEDKTTVGPAQPDPSQSTVSFPTTTSTDIIFGYVSGSPARTDLWQARVAINFANFGVLFTVPPEFITTFNNSKKSSNYQNPFTPTLHREGVLLRRWKTSQADAGPQHFGLIDQHIKPVFGKHLHLMNHHELLIW